MTVALSTAALSCRRSAGSPGESATGSSAASAEAACPAPAKGKRATAGHGSLGGSDADQADRYVEMTVAGVAATAHGSVVLLVDAEKKQAVPIFVGDAEALSIRLRLERRRFERPLTHDLFEAALGRLGGQVRDVRIEQLESQTFFATVVLVRGPERFELDARSSDAIALALGNHAPIHVSEAVVQDAAVDVDRLNQLLEPGGEPLDLPGDPDAGEPVAL